MFESTGGIIALGLGLENWPVTECISKFKNLCGQAFTERELHSVPLLGNWAKVNHRSAYKTRPFEIALRDVFGHEDDLFGGFSQSKCYARHVAVTTTTGLGSEARILTNYNRPKMENRKSYDRRLKCKLTFRSGIFAGETRKKRIRIKGLASVCISPSPNSLPLRRSFLPP